MAKSKLVNVAVIGSYMLNPQPAFLAKLIRAIAQVEDLSTVQLLVTDSKGVADAARNVPETHGRVFTPDGADGAAKWRKRTERMVKAAHHALVITTGKQGVDNNESAFFIQAAKAAQLPLQIIRI